MSHTPAEKAEALRIRQLQTSDVYTVVRMCRLAVESGATPSAVQCLADAVEMLAMRLDALENRVSIVSEGVERAR